jgi:hypothetical protein
VSQSEDDELEEQRLRDLLGRSIPDLRVPLPVFIPEIGFRAPTGGLRMTGRTTFENDSTRLTIHHLVSTPAGTELAFEISGLRLTPGASEAAWMRDKVTVRDDRGREYSHQPGTWVASGQSIGTGDRSTVRRSMTLEPIDRDVRMVELIIRGVVGDWVVPVAVAPLDETLTGTALATSDSRDGITVTLRHVTFGAQVTALDLEVAADASIRFVRGLGALFGLRRGPSQLVLRDSRGREYAEVEAPPSQPSDPMGKTYVAVFGTVPADAGAIELRVPYVVVEEVDGVADFELPVATPRALTFGRYPIRVMGSSPLAPRPSAPTHAQHLGVALQLDLGDWVGDRRLVVPGRVHVDGGDHGYSFGPLSPGEDAPAREIQVRLADPDAARRVSFRYPTVQVRGPWVLRFLRGEGAHPSSEASGS